jgi:hypothetical protein
MAWAPVSPVTPPGDVATLRVVEGDAAAHDPLAGLRAAEAAYDEDETQALGLRDQAIRDAYAAGVSRDVIASIVGSVPVDEILGPGE